MNDLNMLLSCFREKMPVQNGALCAEAAAPLPLVVHVGPAHDLAAEVEPALLGQLE